MLLYCQSCFCDSAHFSGADTPEFAKWYKGHFSECNINYTGDPGGKEAAAAESLWGRSVNKHGFRYTTALLDCDSRTFTHLCEKNVYGELVIM